MSRHLLFAAVTCAMPFFAGADEAGLIEVAKPLDQREFIQRSLKSDQSTPFYCYSIKSISTFGGSLTLEDDSVWDVGLLSMPKVSGWEEGDQIALWYEPSFLAKSIELYNVTKRESGWADVSSLPKKYSVRGLWVAYTADEGALVCLNNGLLLRSPYCCFRNAKFREGARVILFSTVKEGQRCFALWHEKGLLAIDLEMVQ